MGKLRQLNFSKSLILPPQVAWIHDQNKRSEIDKIKNLDEKIEVI